MQRIRRLAPVLSIALIGVVLSVLAYSLVSSQEYEEAVSHFERDANEYILTMEEHTEITLRAILAVSAFVDSSNKLSAPQFDVFASNILSNNPGVMNISWLEKVSASEISDPVNDIKAPMSPDGSVFTGETINPQTIPRQKAEYFPVMFMKTREALIHSPGTGLSDDDFLSAGIEEARRTAREVIVTRRDSQSEKMMSDEITMLVPQFDNWPENREKRLAGNLRGFVMADISIRDMLRPLYPGLKKQHKNISAIDLYIFEKQKADSQQPLHIYRPDLGENTSAPVLNLGEAKSGVYWSHVMNVASRQWVVIARPVNANFGLAATWISWGVMWLILLLTFALVFYLIQMVKKRNSIERYGKDVSRSLRDSKLQLQAIVDNVLDGLITITADGIIQSYNKAAEGIFGYRADEVIGRNIKMLMPSPYQDEHDTYLANYLRSGEKKIIGLGREVQGQRKNGVVFPLDLAVSEISIHNKPLFIGSTRDLTDSKQATRDIERFKYVLDNTLDMIFMFDAETLQFNYLNRGAVVSMGYTHEELLHMTPYDIKPLLTESEFRRLIEPLIKGQQSTLHFETLHRRKDCSDFHVEIFLQLVKEPGCRALFVAFVRDITQRKMLEYESQQYAHALEKMHNITAAPGLSFNEKIESLLSLGRKFFKLPVAVISRIEGHQHTVEYVSGSNDAPALKSERLLSETCCDEVIKANTAIGFHNMQDNQYACFDKSGLKAFIGTPVIVKGDLYGTLSFSSRVEARENPFLEGDYSLLRLFSQWIGNEMTRIRVEDELHDNAARLGNILNTVADAIITFNEMGVIESLNVAGSDLFAYKHDELVGKPFGILLSAQESSQYMQYLSEYLATGQSRVLGTRVEASGVRKDNSVVPIEFAVNDMLLGGRRYFTAVARDITERKKIERMKNEFVSTVSHELRTPLTSIRGALSLVLGKLGTELNEKTRYMLEMANRNSERLTYLINDILDLEKMDAGQLEFAFERLDFSLLAQRALEENESFARSHNVQLKFIDKTDAPADIYADPHRLLQVMANLISNAVKYTAKDGVVSITLEPTDHKLRLQVSNQGPAIPEGFRSRIFERFAQADSSDTRDKGGTGLGLAITKAIVERHSGKIDYQSEEGMTTFFFDMPCWKGTSISTQQDPEKPRVLICEDNADVAEVLAGILSNEGFICDIAVTLKDARVLLASTEYKLLMLDLVLPDGDGLQFLLDMRDGETEQHLPVIVVSARATEGRSEFKGDAVAIVDWMQKPIDHIRMSNALQQVLRINNRPRVLHVEDDLDVVQVTRTILEEVGDIDFVTTLSEAKQRLKSNEYDLVILDISLPDGSGLELLDVIGDVCPVVIFSGEETSKEVSQKVVASLTKARTDNAQLLKTIRQVLTPSLEEKTK